MTPELVAWLILGTLALVVLHELTHVLVARCHGYPIICVVVTPLGVGMLFEDAPRLRYWSLQVSLPAIVSWVVGYLWLSGVILYPMSHAGLLDVNTIEQLLAHLPRAVTILVLLISSADIVNGCTDLVHPVNGRARAERGLVALGRMRAFVLFTAYGRDQWRASLGRDPGGAPV